VTEKFELNWDLLLVEKEFDKMVQLHKSLARLFGSYYSELINHGCSEDLAGALVLDRQVQLLSPPESVDSDEGCNCGCGGK
jgi:hypothetical protein